MRRERLTALCGTCGETCKEYLSAAMGKGWNCLRCGYLTKDQVGSTAQLENPAYSDGSAVLWLPETPLQCPLKSRNWTLNGLTTSV
jgi:hypothetical protein